MRAIYLSLGLAFLGVAACGGDDGSGTPDAGAPRCDDPPGPFATGDEQGNADPLGAASGEARAGRLTGEMISAADGPEFLTWEAGDYVLANDHVALVIEQVDDSDLYDPWGGRPVALGQVEGGQLVRVADYGENFFLLGASAIVTTSVTVMNDGSDGNPAVVRATGKLATLPFLSAILGAIFFDDYADVEAAIDYTLAGDSSLVEISMHFASPRAVTIDSGAVVHGFMFTERAPPEAPGLGFGDHLNGSLWAQLIDDNATSWAYRSPGEALTSSISVSGFLGAFTPAYTVAACGVTDRVHAELLIGEGVGLDGLEVARAKLEARTLRTITGTVTDGTQPVRNVRVHATTSDGTYLTRASTEGDGTYTLHVPDGQDVTLTAYKQGWQVATTDVAAADATGDITLPQGGEIHVVATENGSAVPARVQVLPAGASTIPAVPSEFGEVEATSGRIAVEFPVNGDISIQVPTGDWQVIVSRGYEYDLYSENVSVAAGETVPVSAPLTRVVDTYNVQCGDFHIHTHRSNDSGDDATRKVMSAAADGLELPVRTDHEYVESFQPLIESLGLEQFAFGIGSIEMTSFQVWGHMGVFPLQKDASKPNGGAPIWQTWPTADDPDTAVSTMNPKDVFATVRARPEQPAIIINHPRGSSDYFGYCGLDSETGDISRPEAWDEDFKLVEVFNDSSWLSNRNGTVADWFALLNTGRQVFAVGSSDSHGIKSSPVGYPRTCITVGTDAPSALTANTVRDQLSAGHATVSGGIYVDVSYGAAGPGDTVTGLGASVSIDVRIQAATWVDVDAFDVVVDGVTVQTVTIDPTDADPGNPVIRWSSSVDVPVATAGSWVVIAAYGDTQLAPVHPGRTPFGVTNPLFLEH